MSKIQVCPSCGSGDITIQSRVYAAQTYYMPEEREYRVTCHECSYEGEDCDEIEVCLDCLEWPCRCESEE